MASSKKRNTGGRRKSTKRRTSRRRRTSSVKTLVVGKSKYRISRDRKAPSLSATSVKPYTTKKSNNDGNMYCSVPINRTGTGKVQRWVKCSSSSKYPNCNC
jgi:hypothetical protein